MTDLRGISPIIATPFTPGGEVDYESMRHLVRRLIESGCHSVTLFGIAGEYYKLSEDEQRRMIDLVVAECRRAGVPSVISITQHATELAVKQAQYTEAAGADALMLLPPFFLKPSGGDLYTHMKLVGQAVTIPVMVQYAPEQTGVGIEPGVFQRLGQEVENIIYYKIECKPVGGYITKLLELTGGRAKVLVGNAGYQMIEAFDRGAIGAMPGCSMYDLYLKIYERYFTGRRPEAVTLHNALLPMLNHIRQSVEQIIYYEKKILQRRGLIESSYCRLPTFTADSHFDRLFDEYYEALSVEFNQPALVG